MSKNIVIADDVYERLSAEKGDKSFSEVIAAHLETETKIADVTGQQIFNPETADRVSEEIGRLSAGTMDRLTDDAA